MSNYEALDELEWQQAKKKKKKKSFSFLLRIKNPTHLKTTERS